MIYIPFGFTPGADANNVGASTATTRASKHAKIAKITY